MPMPRVQCRTRLVHGQPLQLRLLAGDDHVDVVAAAQAVVGHREQAVGVGRQVDADDLGLLVDDVVDEARVLVREAVVVLAPDVRGEQVVQRGDRPPPGDVAGHLEPLGVLVEHRVDDVDEGLVAVEQAVPAGEQVALQPALAEVLGEDLHDAAVGGEVVVAGDDLRLERPVGDLEDRPRAGWRPSRRARRGGSCWGWRRSRRAGTSPAPGWPRRTSSPGLATVDRVVAEVGQRQVAQQAGRRWRAGWRSCGGSSWAASAASSGDERPVLVEELLRAVAAHPGLEQRQVLGVGRAPRVSGTWWSAQGALDGQAVDDLGPGPALGRAQHDHRPARAVRCRRSSRAARWIAWISCTISVEDAGHALVHVRPGRRPDEVRVVAVALEQLAQLVVARCAPAPSGWRSCSRSGAGSAARRRRDRGRGTCWSASSPPAGPSRPRRRRRRSTTSRSGLSKAAP